MVSASHAHWRVLSGKQQGEAGRCAIHPAALDRRRHDAGGSPEVGQQINRMRAGHFGRIARRMLIGWNVSREAAHAVNDVMPLLIAADAVTVLIIDAEQSLRPHGEVHGADIALHLARHGVRAQVERTVSAGIDIGNTLLSGSVDLEADMLVMGAYGHSRVRELLLGGATRTVLTSMTLPVLMSH